MMRTESCPAGLESSRTVPRLPGLDQRTFVEQGYIGPRPLFSREECRQLLGTISQDVTPPLDWDKGGAATSRAVYEIGSDPRILEIVCETLGPAVLIWGASIQQREPGRTHPWHSDIETAAPSARAVSVWIGLENTCREASLTVVSYSHRFGEAIQLVRQKHNKNRRTVSDTDIANWARERHKRARVIELDTVDGDAVFFDGRLWHGSSNLTDRVRTALLLQYATPDTEILIPDYRCLDWPFQKLDVPRPPCVLLRGTDAVGVNRVVSAPVATSRSGPELTTRILPLTVPQSPDRERGFKRYPMFSGSTGSLQTVSCHTSVLNPGHSPHDPHDHEEEEILIVLDGEVELLTAEKAEAEKQGQSRLCSGGFVYYPVGFKHSLIAVGESPANYLIIKWAGPTIANSEPLRFRRFQLFGEEQPSDDKKLFRSKLLFEGPTRYLRQLRSHVSTVMPGGGYEPHIDSHDVGVVVFEGEVETLGRRVRPYDLIFYRAGEPHGMLNPGDLPAKYLVFEFHGR